MPLSDRRCFELLFDLFVPSDAPRRWDGAFAFSLPLLSGGLLLAPLRFETCLSRSSKVTPELAAASTSSEAGGTVLRADAAMGEGRAREDCEEPSKCGATLLL